MKPDTTATVAKTGQTENIESRIIEAAKQEFIKNGYVETSMSDIAAAAGINRPTLHYYFRTKEKMFQAVFASIVGAFLPHIDLIFSKPQPLEKKLEEIIDIYISKFIIGEIHRDANHLIDTFYSIGLNKYLQHIGEALEQEMEKGNIKREPLHLVFMTFYSQLAFPFLSKPLTKSLFFHESDEEFEQFLQMWKKHIIAQVLFLLRP